MDDGPAHARRGPTTDDDRSVPRPRLLFTFNVDAPFVEEDLRLLGRHYTVEVLRTPGFLSLFRIPPLLRRAEASVTWFASTYASAVVLAGRLLGRPSLVIVGGVDAARRPDLGYGIWLHPLKAPLVRWAVRHATRVLVVAPRLGEDLQSLAEYDGGNIRWIPTGYDASVWIPGSGKKPVILTVAACHDLPRLRAKGVDHFLRCAAAMPEREFHLVGTPGELLASAGLHVPANVHLFSPVSRENLLPHYQQAAVYFLPSENEGMPNSLCEAMLCHCVPVATEVGAVPEILGEVGFRIPAGDIPAAVAALESALAAPPRTGEEARVRIAQHFPQTRREKDLRRCIDEVLR
jgi:glycosyltransferase involved in cell wall biosynthesis